MKIGLLLVAGLFFATTAQAQRTHSAASMSSGINYNSGGIGSGYIGPSDLSMHHHTPVKHEISYAKNDGAFIPSTYMNYDDALALGKQQLAAGEQTARSEANLSLGEIARMYRNVKITNFQASLVQGDSQKLEVCSLNGDTCRRL